tara:strand:+ start:556 stop:1017 length:462 start_codon:yes stop_codon:yes gene_type:complete
MNNKHLVIIILLILIFSLAYKIQSSQKKENFQYNDNYVRQSAEIKAKKCSESLDILVNIVESLKSVNLPPELAQELAKTIVTDDPKNEQQIEEIISDLEITDTERKKLIDLTNAIKLNNKGIFSLKLKKAVYDSKKINKLTDKYVNDMIYELK